MPRIQLVAFDRIPNLSPGGAAKSLTFTINPDQLAVWHDDKGFVVEPGGCEEFYYIELFLVAGDFQQT